MTSYYVSTQVKPVLMRRQTNPDGIVDEAFINGAWRPTGSIVDYMAGEDDFVDPVSEAEARKTAPAAFA